MMEDNHGVGWRPLPPGHAAALPSWRGGPDVRTPQRCRQTQPAGAITSALGGVAQPKRPPDSAGCEVLHHASRQGFEQ